MYLYAILCLISSLSCDVIIRDTSIKEIYTDKDECLIARPVVALDYINKYKDYSVRLICDDRDVLDVPFAQEELT